MREFCERLTEYCFQKNIVLEEDKNPFRFGLELVLTQVITILSIFILGLLMNHTMQTIMFCIIFVSSRKIFQGYHAQTFFKCYILTILFYISVELILKLSLPFYYVNVISLIFIFVYYQKHQDTKYQLLLFLLFFILSIGIFFYINYFEYINLYSIVLFLVSILAFFEEK